eukprot:m.103923 g.103923  ORF g.103923 m.103923 type:complete len:1203 (+) comp37198_c0_seq7:224-3832(+)
MQVAGAEQVCGRILSIAVASLLLLLHSAGAASVSHGTIISMSGDGVETPWPRSSSADSIRLRIEAFYTSFSLTLYPSPTSLSNRTIVVQRIGPDGILRAESDDESNIRRCGTYGFEESSHLEAAVSICLPVVGYFHTSDFLYLIEPLELGDDGGLLNLYVNESRLGVVIRRRRTQIPYTAEADLSREKRATKEGEQSRVRTIKAMVVTDMLTYRHLKKQTETYAMTTMGIVHTLMQGISPRYKVEFVVNRLVIIEKNDAHLEIGDDMKASLLSFCNFQHQLQHHTGESKSPPDPTDYDTAILLSKYDWKQAGATISRAVCHQKNSCSINYANGLSAAFTVAHNLGVALGILRDGQSNTCTEQSGDYGIMAPSHGDGNNPWVWSSCSRLSATKLLSQSNIGTKCLLDSARESTFLFSRQLPGRAYSLDEQCQLTLGSNAKACLQRSPPCEMLWCKPKPSGSCQTDNLPWADGTHCPGDKKSCYRGHCVDAGALKGGFGSWSDWGPCSLSCGGGVATAQRKCRYPRPVNKGRDCEGSPLKFIPCNVRACPEGDHDLRKEQCAQFNGSAMGFRQLESRETTVRWIPVYKRKTKFQCKLFCSTENGAFVLRSPPDVIDGTPCRPDLPGMCAHGQCKRAGCDRILGSRKELDLCGVCGGNSSTCYRIAGHLSEVNGDFQLAVTVESGSANIRVHQREILGGGHHLVLRDSHGRVLLAGNDSNRFVIFRVGDAWWKYERKSDGSEHLRCTTPLKYAVYVEVHKQANSSEAGEVGSSADPLDNQEKDRLVTWQYYAPLTNPEYLWRYAGVWSICSADCQGSQFRSLKCVRLQGEQIESSQKCSHLPLAMEKRQVRPCHTHCRYSWSFVANAGHCSVTCGSGVQNMTVYCIKTLRGIPAEKVSDSRCVSEEKPLPRIQRCSLRLCTAEIWRTGRYGLVNEIAWRCEHFQSEVQCSTKCGNGNRSRRVECVEVEEKNLSGEELRCDQPKPKAFKSCRGRECPLAGNASSCLEWQKRGYGRDMEYNVEKDGRLLRVYCRGMTGGLPKEFLTLPGGEMGNYARIFPHYLERPQTCPTDVADPKYYKKQLYSERGFSSFSKVRLLLDELEIRTDDLTFATANGSRPEYASAGDCFSQEPCPQGTFRVDLSGTGLELASVSPSQWTLEGNLTPNHIAIYYKPGGHMVVNGSCGGLCGRCFVVDHRLKLRFRSSAY